MYGKGTMGIDVFSYTFPRTYLHVRVESLHAKKRKLRTGVPPVLRFSLRRHVRAIYLAWQPRSFFVGPMTTTEAVDVQECPSKYTPHPSVLSASWYLPHRVFLSLCLQVRRATEAVQRLCQCPSEKCSKLKVRKVGEGRYHIAGRNVFIRVSTFISAIRIIKYY